MNKFSLLKNLGIGVLAAGLSLLPQKALPEDKFELPKDNIEVSEDTPKKEESLEEKILSKFSLSLRTDLITKYVFRGIIFTDDTVLQPIQTLTYDDPTLGRFQLIGFENINRRRLPEQDHNFNEADIILYWEKVFVDKFGFALRTAYFTNPGTEIPPTTELGGALFLPTVPLMPRLTVTHDFDEGGRDAGKGLNTELMLAHEQLIGSQKFVINETIGYHGGYDGKSDYYGNRGFYSTLSIGIPIVLATRKISDKLTKDLLVLTPNINWTTPIYDKDNMPGVKDRVYGGMNLEIKF